MVVAQTSQSEMSKLREEIEYLNKKLKKPQDLSIIITFKERSFPIQQHLIIC